MGKNVEFCGFFSTRYMTVVWVLRVCVQGVAEGDGSIEGVCTGCSWRRRFCVPVSLRPDALTLEVSRSHTPTHHKSVGFLWTSDQLVAETRPDNTKHSQQTDIHALAGFEPTIPSAKRPQNYALYRATTGIDHKKNVLSLNSIDVVQYLSNIYWLPKAHWNGEEFAVSVVVTAVGNI